MPIIPFYGADDPELFEIERTAMDRQGLVIDALAERLPDSGLVMDVGAGNGFTGTRLASADRTIVGVEPAAGMIDAKARVTWVRGDAAHLPFVDAGLDAAYATWAYFFTRGWDPSAGIAELHRTVKAGGPLLIVDNLGGDEFEAMATGPLSADVEVWARHGFACHPIETAFEFENQMDSTRLLSAYFGPMRDAPLTVQFRVALFAARSRGPS